MNLVNNRSPINIGIFSPSSPASVSAFTRFQRAKAFLEQRNINLDGANTMQILSLENIAVEMENGERREEVVKNGMFEGRNIREGKFTLNLQSNYFHDSDSLKILIGAVHAVPKGEDFIEVDFGTKEVLTKPDYLDWDISVTEQGVAVAAKKWNDRMRHSFLNNAVKADG